jgi:anaerobic selenocysteine-containing dehydrogenase
MKDEVQTLDDLWREETARLVMDMFHRILIHYALWFTEVRHQMGLERALAVLKDAAERSISIQLNRLSKIMGFEMQDGLPQPLLKMSKESLQQLLDGGAANWLANDGVWFQAVEFSSGMDDAKRCNDSCWAFFSPFEAWSIKNFPLVLTSSKSRFYLHSSYRWLKPLREKRPQPKVEVHPETAEKLGVRHGDAIIIETSRGKITQIAHVTDAIHPQVINCAYGWWFPEATPESQYDWQTSNFNVLTSMEILGKAFGTPNLKGINCRVRRR